MFNINLNTKEGYNVIVLPDNQPHIQIKDFGKVGIHKVTCSLSGSPCQRLIELCMVAEVLNRKGIFWELHIPYLLGARWDRVMPTENDSFDLKVITNIINSLKAIKVYLYDPHSDVAAALIENSVVVDNRPLVEAYNKPDAVLIIPDAGAAKKANKYLEWNKNIKEIVHCIKHRDLATGAITLKVLEPDICKGENCVIIDDICDGGGTFNAIAEQIDPLSLTLIVSHGIFSKGFADLAFNFNYIITSDSYPFKKEPTDLSFELVKVIPWINS